MRPLLATIGLAALAACASSGGRTAGSPDQPVSKLGIYEFSATIQGRMVSGRLHFRADTVLVDSESGDCAKVTSDARSVNVACRGTEVVTSDQNRAVTGALLRFDRGNPGQSAKWVGNFPVQRRREVCARYEVRSGREVCAAMKTESYESMEPKSGPVQVRRIL